MARKAAKPTPVMPVYHIFEITGFEPTYMLSVNARDAEKKPWREHISLEFSTVCRHPKKVAGRPATFHLVADREFWNPHAGQSNENWRTRCVGVLDLPPTAGRFYASIPHDSIPGHITAMAHGLYRYILLWGPPLVRGKSLCTSLEFRRTVDLDDF